MLWLKKLNFMETAKLEMELMKALDAGEDLEAKLAAQQQLAASTGDAEQAWKQRCGTRCCRGFARWNPCSIPRISRRHPPGESPQLGIRSITLITRPTAITGGEIQRSITSRKRCSQIGLPEWLSSS